MLTDGQRDALPVMQPDTHADPDTHSNSYQNSYTNAHTDRWRNCHSDSDIVGRRWRCLPRLSDNDKQYSGHLAGNLEAARNGPRRRPRRLARPERWNGYRGACRLDTDRLCHQRLNAQDVCVLPRGRSSRAGELQLGTIRASGEQRRHRPILGSR